MRRFTIWSIPAMCCSLALAAGCEPYASESVSEAPATQSDPVEVSAPLIQQASLEGQKVEIGCGLCTYDMPDAEGCVPAVLIEGHPLLVSGVQLDAHDHGLCSAAKTAVVTGEVRDGTFVATALEVQEDEPGS